MKKILTALLLFSTLLTACTGSPANTAPPTATSTGITASTTAAPQTTTPPVTTPPELPPKTEPVLPPEPVTYPTYEGNEAVEILAKLPADNSDYIGLSVRGDRILLNYAFTDPDSMMYVSAHALQMDLYTGLLTEAATLPSPDCTATLLENGNICITDPVAGTAKVYTPDGKEYLSYTYPQSGGMHLIATGSGALYCYRWDTPALTRVDLSTGATADYTVPGGIAGYIAGNCGDIICYSVWDGDTRVIYTLDKAGEFTRLNHIQSNHYWGGGIFYTDSAPYQLHSPLDSQTYLQLPDSLGISWVISSDANHYLVECPLSDSQSEYRVIDCRGDTLSAPLQFPANRWMECTFQQGAYIYFVTRDDNGTAYLCRWDSGAQAQSVDIQRLRYDQKMAQIDAVAQRIRDRFGVYVYYKPDVIHYVASDYSTVAVTDYDLLRDQILLVEQALSAYPDGFFDDLCYGDYDRLELYLCGKFTPLDEYGIDSAEALANTRGSALVIGFDIYLMNNEYTRVLAHELMHNMERRIDQIDFMALEEWISLTPGGHDAYYYSYHHDNGEEMNDGTNTFYFEFYPEDAYFIDPYSKSFPTEDRARIFEKLMESGGDPIFTESPVLMAKARTLCHIIREFFPSVAAIDRASWELVS